MIIIPASFIIRGGSTRNVRSNRRPTKGNRGMAMTQINDSTTPRLSGPKSYLSSSRRLNCSGTAISAKPTTPTPTER